MKGMFGNMFDFNRDGKMDAIEMAAEFHFFNDVIMGEDEAGVDECEDDSYDD